MRAGRPDAATGQDGPLSAPVVRRMGTTQSRLGNTSKRLFWMHSATFRLLPPPQGGEIVQTVRWPAAARFNVRESG